jgi:hypothetical protein
MEVGKQLRVSAGAHASMNITPFVTLLVGGPPENVTNMCPSKVDFLPPNVCADIIEETKIKDRGPGLRTKERKWNSGKLKFRNADKEVREKVFWNSVVKKDASGLNKACFATFRDGQQELPYEVREPERVLRSGVCGFALGSSLTYCTWCNAGVHHVPRCAHRLGHGAHGLRRQRAPCHVQESVNMNAFVVPIVFLRHRCIPSLFPSFAPWTTTTANHTHACLPAC